MSVVPFRPPGGNGECVDLLPREAIRAPGEPGPAEPACRSCPALSAAGEPQSLWAAGGGGLVVESRRSRRDLRIAPGRLLGSEGRGVGRGLPAEDASLFLLGFLNFVHDPIFTGFFVQPLYNF